MFIHLLFKFKFKVLIGSFLQQSLSYYNVTMNGIFKIGNNTDLADKYFLFLNLDYEFTSYFSSFNLHRLSDKFLKYLLVDS